MNDQERLQEMLECATAPGEATPADLDAETASLREAWLTLGRSLAAVDSARPALGEVPTTSVSPARPRLYLPPAAIFALAASLLVAALVAVQGSSGRKVAQQDSPQGGDPVTGQRVVSEDPAVKQLSYWEWDEQLDTEISNVARTAIWPAEHSSAWAESYTPLEGQVQRLQEDLNDGTF